jgi:flavin reductase ActVB
MPVSRDEFRNVLAPLSAPVTIVTADDENGRPRGFTASAVCSLSPDPPRVLVCIARTALCHDVVVRAPTFAVNVLRDSHQDLAERFTTSGVDRFAGSGFHGDPWAPHLPDALSALTCSVHATHPAVTTRSSSAGWSGSAPRSASHSSTSTAASADSA